jgi:hypothetical protein
MHKLHTCLAALLVALLMLPVALAQATTQVALVTTVAGSAGVGGSADGVGAAARFSDPSGVAISVDGAIALVADPDNQTLRISLVPVSPRVSLPLIRR